MENRRKSTRVVSSIIFSLGVLLGAIFFGGAVWADFEAFLFDPTLAGDQALRGVHCPILITTAETGVITATFTHHGDDAREYRFRAHISDGFATLYREENVAVTLEPGESQTVSWEITPEDAVWGNFILARLYRFPRYPDPDRATSCGVLLIDNQTLTGVQISLLTILGSLVGMFAGIGLWTRIARPIQGRDRYLLGAMTALALIVLIGICLSFLGSWMLAALCLFVTVLLCGVAITFMLIGGE